MGPITADCNNIVLVKSHLGRQVHPTDIVGVTPVNCIKTAFHDTDIVADILAISARMSARMSVSWNAVFMQLSVSAQRPVLVRGDVHSIINSPTLIRHVAPQVYIHVDEKEKNTVKDV